MRCIPYLSRLCEKFVAHTAPPFSAPCAFLRGPCQHILSLFFRRPYGLGKAIVLSELPSEMNL